MVDCTPITYNWELKSGSLGGSNAQTSQLYDFTTGTVTTTFDTQRFSDGTDLSIARTILHEAVHAYLISHFRSNPLIANETYQMMVNENMKGDYPNQNALQHAEFIRSFISDIGDALQQFGSNKGYSISSTYYQKLAWGALTHWLKTDENGEVIEDASGNPVYEETPWFKAAFSTSEERDSVFNIILTEQGISNTENQKGTDANC
ncbi:MAG TPA: hypothetical protein VLA13_09675 [Massilibacterium sp.]|nr:hypothetical protein [Massilibacterium sp.]